MAQIFQLYKAVIFLVTSAKGNKDWYRKDNNPARYETAEQAIEADDRLQQAWNGHPHLILVQPEERFDTKMHRLWQAVQRALGIPVSLEIERKFLVKTPFNPHSISCQRIFLEQMYLEGNSGERVRMRSQDGHPIYYQTQKIDTDKATTRQEKEWQITEKEYCYLIENKADRSRERIRKDRHCFLFKNQYFELDVFLEPARLRGLTLLEIELTEENDQIQIPEFLGQIEEVTENPEYKNFNLAKKA